MEVTVPMLPAMPLDLPYKHPQSWFFPLKVYADFAGYVDGALVESARGSDYIDIGSDEWIDGFEEAFIGMKTGKTKKVKIAVPDGTYGDDSIDGKTVEFKLTLHYICGDEIVPDFTDDFVQSISDYNTI